MSLWREVLDCWEVEGEAVVDRGDADRMDEDVGGGAILAKETSSNT